MEKVSTPSQRKGGPITLFAERRMIIFKMEVCKRTFPSKGGVQHVKSLSCKDVGSDCDFSVCAKQRMKFLRR